MSSEAKAVRFKPGSWIPSLEADLIWLLRFWDPSLGLQTAARLPPPGTASSLASPGRVAPRTRVCLHVVAGPNACTQERVLIRCPLGWERSPLAVAGRMHGT